MGGIYFNSSDTKITVCKYNYANYGLGANVNIGVNIVGEIA
jgi:hypothetical protein